MMLDHLPRLNVALAIVVVMCFFLPWLSLDCGNVSFIKLSGFQMATGKLPLDKEMISGLAAKMGTQSEGMDALTEQSQNAPAKLYLFLVLILGIALLYYGFMMINDFTVAKGMLVTVLNAIGLAFCIIGAIFDFGLEIPRDAEMFIHSTYQVGFYGTLLAFIIGTAINPIALRTANAYPASELVSLPIEIPMQQVPGEDIFQAVDTPMSRTDQSEASAFGELPPVAPHDSRVSQRTQQRSFVIPKGKKPCPSCRTPVGEFQIKCHTCGTSIKGSKIV